MAPLGSRKKAREIIPCLLLVPTNEIPYLRHHFFLVIMIRNNEQLEADSDINSNDDSNENNGTEESLPDENNNEIIYVDIIIPAYNAASTIDASIQSAMEAHTTAQYDVVVCAYNDGSTDDTQEKLIALQSKHSRLLLDHGPISRGAGYARNRAASMRALHHVDRHFLCLLDSDDIMHPDRLMEQIGNHMMKLSTQQRHKTILGCQFHRDPIDATWHYADWANGLSDQRIMLERYREVTILQPTWVMTKHRFQLLGGYLEADLDYDLSSHNLLNDNNQLRLIHTTMETPDTIRLAEDLRFMYAHLHDHGRLALHRIPLITYRHAPGMSQSSQTSRKLLLQLRAMALELAVLTKWNDSVVIWGAGRDGKDFVKALSPQARKKIYCFVDVDYKKIDAGYYANKELNVKIPIVHYSHLIKDKCLRMYVQQADHEPHFGRIQKGKLTSYDQPFTTSTNKPPPCKRRKGNDPIELDMSLLPNLPIVVCVAMYRTNGALEANVASVGRTEGEDLWHFS
jgi:glycosyltransferase involved in cell wall biosynthesis